MRARGIRREVATLPHYYSLLIISRITEKCSIFYEQNITNLFPKLTILFRDCEYSTNHWAFCVQISQYQLKTCKFVIFLVNNFVHNLSCQKSKFIRLQLLTFNHL